MTFLTKTRDSVRQNSTSFSIVEAQMTFFSDAVSSTELKVPQISSPPVPDFSDALDEFLGIWFYVQISS